MQLKKKEVYEVTDKNDERTCFRCTAGASFLKIKLKFDTRSVQHFPDYDINRALYHCPMCGERYFVTYRQNIVTPRRAKKAYHNERSQDAIVIQRSQAQLKALRKAIKNEYNRVERERAKAKAMQNLDA